MQKWLKFVSGAVRVAGLHDRVHVPVARLGTGDQGRRQAKTAAQPGIANHGTEMVNLKSGIDTV